MNCRKVQKYIKEYVKIEKSVNKRKKRQQSVNKYKKCKICPKFSIKLHFYYTYIFLNFTTLTKTIYYIFDFCKGKCKFL